MSLSRIESRVREEARAADELHQQSRALLVAAVRAGADAGLSQRQIAAAVGRSQPEVSRLLRFHNGGPLGKVLASKRKQVIEIAQSYGVSNLRVFGSVARGAETADSDIDLLVDIPSGMSLLGLARLEDELGQLLGVDVDVVPSRALRPHLAEPVLKESVPL